MPFLAKLTNSFTSTKSYDYTPIILPGESVYTTNGAFLFTVPTDVTSISAVAIGGGGSAYGVNGGVSGGGGGGGLGWKNNIPVTPSSQLVVQVGRSGTQTSISPTWNTPSYEIRKGGTSFVGSYNGTIVNCTSNATSATIRCTDTTNVVNGAYLSVASGNGLFISNTIVTGITNSTAFTISFIPIINLESSSVYMSTNVYVAGYGGGYPTGYSGSANSRNTGYYNLAGGNGGGYLGDGGGNGGNGGYGAVYQGTAQFTGGGGGGGGAGGYSGNGGAGGTSNGSDAVSPTAGSNGSGGAAGGGAGAKSIGNSSGYLSQTGGAGGGVGLYGGSANGTGGAIETYHMAGRSGLGGSNGLPSYNEYIITTTYSGANTTSGFGPYSITASGSNNFSSIGVGWIVTGGPSSGQSARITSISSNTSASYENQYSYGARTTTNSPVLYYRTGRTNADTFYGAGAAGADIRTQSAGGGAVRIIWGTGRAFPNTNTQEII